MPAAAATADSYRRAVAARELAAADDRAPFRASLLNSRGELLTVDERTALRLPAGVALDWILAGLATGRTEDGRVSRVAEVRVWPTARPERVAVLRREAGRLVVAETGRDHDRDPLIWALVHGWDMHTRQVRCGATVAEARADLAATYGVTAEEAAELVADPEPAAEEPATLVVVPCGRKKLPHAAPAADLYVGNRLAQQAAATIAARTPGARVVILSALHGLVDLADVIEPYDVTMGDADAIAPDVLAAQLAATGARRVVALTPKAYSAALAAACEVTGAELVDRLAGSRGLPEQRGRLARIRDAVTDRPAESRGTVELAAPATVGPDLARFVARARGRRARIAPTEQLTLFAA